jgi:BlaR1 peptidase M56
MEALTLYLAKASGLIALFYGAYWLLLKKETFFSPNRWFLLAGLVTAAALPLVTYTKVVWVEVQPVTTLIINAQDVQVMGQFNPDAVVIELQPHITWQDVAWGIYTIGALLFLARFLTDVSFIREQLRAHKATKHGRYRLIDSPQVQSPFSFFNYIVYNSSVLTANELESILEHEKVHSRQHHSIDMIIGQLFCVVLWFNPFAWLYKKAIAQNLEFIADQGATRLLPDAVGYQKTLLKITVQPENIAITNHFYQSLIKKRIVMLNKQKSRRRNSWKYTVVAPALAAFVLAFQVKVVAQEKEQPAVIKADVLQWYIKVDKDTKDSEIKQHQDKIKADFNATANFSNIKRNDKSEITSIKVEVNAEGKNSVYEVSGSQPIKPFTIVMNSNGTNGYTVSFDRPRNVATVYPLSTGNDTIFHDDAPAMVYVAPQPFSAPAPNSFKLTTTSRIPQGGNSVALNFGNSDALVVINGIKYAGGQEIKLPAGHQVTAITTLNEKEGKEKYGKEGKKGVIVITSTPTATVSILPEPPLNIAQLTTGMRITTDMYADFPFEIFDGVNFNEGGFSGLSPEKQQEMGEKLAAFAARQKDAERNMAQKKREEIEKQRGHLQYTLEEKKEVLEGKRAEVEKRRAEMEKRKTEKMAEMEKRKAEIIEKRRIEEERRTKQQEENEKH